MLKLIAGRFSHKARSKRGELFLYYLKPSQQDRILDLGSGTGAHFASIIPYRENVYIADINKEQLQQGEGKFGFKPVLLNESGRLPFPDQFFDIVFCSSVIEHVTMPKNELRKYRNGHDFYEVAFQRQMAFADEIKRVGKRYFVQTPYKYFLIESHTWLPVFFVLLPRSLQIRIIDFLAGWWPKKTTPDWNLLTPVEMQKLFPEARIVHEKVWGITKSIMAVQ